MPETLHTQIEQEIRNNRLYDFPASWSDEIIFPYYDGLSLRNIAHTATDILGVPFANSVPLKNTVWQAEKPSAKRVITFLLDGVGYKHLHLLMETDPELRQAISDLSGGRDIIPLTSVAPSTTVVALTSLWSGAAPAESGITGTLMYLREVSALTNMISFKPALGRTSDSTENWGLSASALNQGQRLADHLKQHNIPTYTITNRLYVGSGLWDVLYSGEENIVTHTAYSDFFVQIENTLKTTRGEQCYIGIYWAGADSLAHTYGAHTPYTAREIRHNIITLRDLLNDPNIHDGETVFMFLADHGHYDSITPIELAQNPIIADALTMSLAGDERHAYAYLRRGTVDAVKAEIDTHFGDVLTYIEPEEALACSYFGNIQNSEIKHRIGDLILIPRLGHILSDPVTGTLNMVGRHAGLSDWEMLIPFMWKTL